MNTKKENRKTPASATSLKPTKLTAHAEARHGPQESPAEDQEVFKLLRLDPQSKTLPAGWLGLSSFLERFI